MMSELLKRKYTISEFYYGHTIYVPLKLFSTLEVYVYIAVSNKINKTDDLSLSIAIWFIFIYTRAL